jgi:hypothetical protein
MLLDAPAGGMTPVTRCAVQEVGVVLLEALA